MASIRQALVERIAALLGVTAFQTTTPSQLGPMLGSDVVNQSREAFGGALETIPSVRLRWYPPDIERAQQQVTTGDFTLVGQLNESSKTDGVVRGLRDARSSVVCFPKIWRGRADVIEVLRSKNASDRDVFEEMIPETEARAMVDDATFCGVSVGEMVPVQGRDFPVLVRRFPQNLYYLWSQNQWYYRSLAGNIPIQPGVPNEEGNSWVLHFAGARLAPWNYGNWNAVGSSYINKRQSIFARQAYEMKHAHPARVAYTTAGTAQKERQGFLTRLIRWALNAAFVLPPGWQLALIEANGRGIEIYEKSIATSDEAIATALLGSSVMLKGTVGFGNMDPFQVMSQDLMRATARPWDHTVNTQILPAFIAKRWGIDALVDATTVETEVKKPSDRKIEADTALSLANAIARLVEAVAMAQIAAGVAGDEAFTIDVREMLERNGIPMVDGVAPTLQLPAAANTNATGTAAA